VSFPEREHRRNLSGVAAGAALGGALGAAAGLTGGATFMVVGFVAGVVAGGVVGRVVVGRVDTDEWEPPLDGGRPYVGAYAPDVDTSDR
jgi:hypothetical protein